MARGKAALLLVLALAPVPGGAYTQNNNSSGLLHWPVGTVIRYTFNENFAPNNNNDLVRAAFRDAFRTWMAVMPVRDGQPAVRFEEAGTTSVNMAGCNLVNLITFTDTGAADQLLSIPASLRLYTPSAGHPDVNCGGTLIPTEPGQLVDVKMLFNPRVKFSTVVQAADTYDIQSIALYLAGLWLGLGGTGINAAVMSGRGLSTGFPVRRLHTDDIASLAAIYGSGPIGPAISGTVTDISGTPVKSAHVVATDASTGITTGSALTDQNGNYRIVGLPSSSYRVFAEPLDGPVALASMPGIFRDGNNNFVTTFLPNRVDVTGGDANNINIRITTPAAMNLGFIGVAVGCGATGLAKSIRRGIDTSITLAGTNLSGDVRFSSPKITLRTPVRQCGSSQQTVFFTADVRVASDAPLGPTDIYFGSSSFTGGLIVTVSPQVPSAGIVDAAAFNRNTSPPHFAPGSIISIFGQDLAEGVAVADSVPLPTQLAGVSVLVGNRLAPLYYVSPTQINAMIPLETTGTSVPVSVVVGNESRGAPVTLTLGTSAPRIFMTNAQGQGAILNGSRNYVLVDQSNPASASDVVVIFCAGLGKVQGDLATGLASNGERTQEAAQVTISGRPAQVQFSGLAPNFVGLYQVNAVVPGGLTPGRVDVVMSTSAGTSNRASISVQ